jgi:probable O-sialoglycoprotein endopeptidase
MEEKGIWKIYIPKFSYTTDNAAMIAMSGHYRYLDGEFCSLDKPAFSRTVF